MTSSPSSLSRRAFLGGVAAVAASSAVPARAGGSASSRPNSQFGGVQIGVITYSFRSLPGGAENTLKYVLQCGINSMELMGNTAEQFAGAPAAGKGQGAAKALLEWRLGASMEPFQKLRQMYEEAGVTIHIVKFPDIGNANTPPEQDEYYFRVAKALGARGITRELSDDAARRLGPLADRHGIAIGFHNHTQITPTTYDGDILSHGRKLAINLDIGHYVAGTNQSPMPLIEKFADRILNLHIKDRKTHNGPNMPFGQGDTPIAQVLQYMKRNRLTFPADIELEYPVPAGSDAVREVAACVEFCRQALV